MEENTHQSWKMNGEGALRTDATVGRLFLSDKDDGCALIMDFSKK